MIDTTTQTPIPHVIKKLNSLVWGASLIHLINLAAYQEQAQTVLFLLDQLDECLVPDQEAFDIKIQETRSRARKGNFMVVALKTIDLMRLLSPVD